MLTNKQVMAIVAVSDLDRARKFYGEVLGLGQTKETVEGVMFDAGGGTVLYAYTRPGARGSEHTEASFLVDDVEREMADLRSKGVVFEEYDMPGLKTERGIATIDGVRAAWFKDPDGNIIAISEMPKAA